MLFNSLHFVAFFPVVVALYFLTPYRWRWLLLLVSSYYFYMAWRVEYALLLLVSTVIDYIAGRRMAGIADKRSRRPYLIMSLVTNLGLLFTFKYFNFLNDSLRALFGIASIPYDVPALDVLLPVGISFYTFQTLSYTIDVYNDRTPAERHFGIFALYVAFWPQLVAGPIERSWHLLPQFREQHDFEYERMRDGLIRMLWGFFKKLVIADRVAHYVNIVYANPDDFGGGTLLFATYLFAFQIYCDFSGYSDIAIGASKVMGFDLMENFIRPYFSRTIGEFWHRWHISLSSWFRDYLYIPLGGNRVSKSRWRFNIMATFVISGLWHGANWTFAVWGTLHGVYILVADLIASRLPEQARQVPGHRRLTIILQILLTFHLVLLAWIFFRANSVTDAFAILAGIITGPLQFSGFPAALSDVDLLLAIGAIVVLLLFEVWTGDKPVDQAVRRLPTFGRWVYYVSTCLAIAWFGVFTQTEFIYFQF